MTRLVAGMAAAGLVTRQAVPTDRRTVLVAATDTGRALLLGGRDRRVATLAGMVARLTPKERRRLDTAAAIIERTLAGQS
jgi:DNA-binding MarR family transcriptional regulator